jgi:anti-sigma regulatory factor (Ser/Thr protein kinase)
VSGPARRTFPGRDEQVRRARRFVTEVLGECPALDEAVLLTSELCTNAVRHSASGAGGTFEVTAYYAAGSLRIEVRDDGAAGMPAARGLDENSEAGRGLEIVAALACRWGLRGDEYGRCVWFELRWNSPAVAGGPSRSEGV